MFWRSCPASKKPTWAKLIMWDEYLKSQSEPSSTRDAQAGLVGRRSKGSPRCDRIFGTTGRKHCGLFWLILFFFDECWRTGYFNNYGFFMGWELLSLLSFRKWYKQYSIPSDRETGLYWEIQREILWAMEKINSKVIGMLSFGALFWFPVSADGS